VALEQEIKAEEDQAAEACARAGKAAELRAEAEREAIAAKEEASLRRQNSKAERDAEFHAKVEARRAIKDVGKRPPLPLAARLGGTPEYTPTPRGPTPRGPTPRGAAAPAGAHPLNGNAGKAPPLAQFI
jgi:regulator of protease activity HflC (stomatin/prohibitin superfamily)